MTKQIIFSLIAIAVLVVAGYLIINNSNQTNNPTIMEPAATSTAVNSQEQIVTLVTNLGEIKFKTYNADAPKTVANFIKLAEQGFYNGVIFHRVIDGFMIQGGDPTGTGRGGPGYTFADELNPATPSYQAGYRLGTVAMANAGPNTNGSQFFIMVADYPLPHDYTIFGQVIEGQEVANQIAKVATDANDKPLSPVTIQSVTITTVN